MTEDVADLVHRARDSRASIKDQHEAFRVLVERFETMALATALEVSDGMDAARDACQEAFRLAWKKLPTLREPAAFGAWLKRLVRTQCARARRRAAAAKSRARTLNEHPDHASDPAELVSRDEVQALVRSAVLRLPEQEREAVLLFHFLGEPLQVVARALGVTAARAGRLGFDARLRLRRDLPRSLTEAFLRRAPAPSFARRVRDGMFDELSGEYRFDERPDHRVVVRREGDVLVGLAGGQRHVMTSRTTDRLTATAYDGEARFHRDRRGRISHFVYYEFGRRLGVARRIPALTSRG